MLQQHIKSAKHENGKTRLAKKEERERNIADMLVKYDKSVHPVGEAVRVYRIKIVSTYIYEGRSSDPLGIFRELLEEKVFRLSDSSNLCELVPIIQKEELVTIQDEIGGKKVSVVFDGTTHVCEAIGSGTSVC